MTYLNVDLATETIIPNDCRVIADKEYPICLLGFQLKNAYDQLRLKIKKIYKFQDYVHFLPDSGATTTFFRGIQLNPLPAVNSLFRQLEQFNISLTDLPVKRYESVLHEYNLSCKECYGNLHRGIYPVDGNSLKHITNDKIDLNDLYENAFDTDSVPIFQSYSYLTIYILSNKSIYRTGTDNLIFKL